MKERRQKTGKRNISPRQTYSFCQTFRLSPRSDSNRDEKARKATVGSVCREAGKYSLLVQAIEPGGLLGQCASPRKPKKRARALHVPRCRWASHIGGVWMCICVRNGCTSRSSIGCRWMVKNQLAGLRYWDNQWLYGMPVVTRQDPDISVSLRPSENFAS